MADTNTLPKPAKRRGFTPRDVAAVFIKCEARCAQCREKVSLGNYAIDHIKRLDALGAHELSNWQLLCSPCHSAKTKVDNWEAKKGARVRGEKGQRARRAKNGPQLVSRSTFDQPPLPNIKARISKSPGSITSGGFKSKLQSRGFDRTKSKKFDGSIRERTVKT